MAGREEPELVWDPRLITPEQALQLVLKRELVVTVDWAELSQFEMEGGGPPLSDRGQVLMRCAECGQAVRLLGQGPPGQETVRLSEIVPYKFDFEGLMTSILRHRVTAHGQPLNRPAMNGGPT